MTPSRSLFNDTTLTFDGQLSGTPITHVTSNDQETHQYVIYIHWSIDTLTAFTASLKFDVSPFTGRQCAMTFGIIVQSMKQKVSKQHALLLIIIP